MGFDSHLNLVSLDGQQRPAELAALELSVDWAPAYELMLSLSCFLTVGPYQGLELGQTWARSIRQQLPSDALARFSRKSFVKGFKDHECDVLALLVHACPGERDATGFLDWFAQLTPGAAYEALAPRVPEPGPRLARDFAAWRDGLLDMLGIWHTTYFRHLDPAILDGLRREAAALHQKVTTQSPLELVEQVTNGLVVEPSPELRSVTLVPQYHHRPYNHHTDIQGGVLLLYPCDAIALPADLPPPGLVRLTRALSDESRLRILRFLANGPCTLTEAARFAGLSQPTVHHHLTQLRAAGLVRIHFVLSSPSRYSLRPHALEQLSEQLGSYLEVAES